MSKNPAKPWRVLAKDRRGNVVARNEAKVDFDELVVGEWLHIERMDHRVWYLRVGERRFSVSVGRTGEVEMTLDEVEPAS